MNIDKMTLVLISCSDKAIASGGRSYEKLIEVEQTLLNIVDELIVYKKFNDFVESIDKHRNHKVMILSSELNNYYENISISSICEAYGIKTIHSSASVQYILTDKELTKLYFKEFNILTPMYIKIIPSKIKNYKKQIDNFKYPAIIKPCFGGGSIGITSASIVKTSQEAHKQLKSVIKLSKSNEPLLLEEFIDGIDLNISMFWCDIVKW